MSQLWSLADCARNYGKLRGHLQALKDFTKRCELYLKFSRNYVDRLVTYAPATLRKELEASVSDLETNWNEIIAAHGLASSTLFAFMTMVAPFEYSWGARDAGVTSPKKPSKNEALEYRSYIDRLARMKAALEQEVHAGDNALKRVRMQMSSFSRLLVHATSNDADGGGSKRKEAARARRKARKRSRDPVAAQDHEAWVLGGSSRSDLTVASGWKDKRSARKLYTLAPPLGVSRAKYMRDLIVRNGYETIVNHVGEETVRAWLGETSAQNPSSFSQESSEGPLPPSQGTKVAHSPSRDKYTEIGGGGRGGSSDEGQGQGQGQGEGEGEGEGEERHDKREPRSSSSKSGERRRKRSTSERQRKDKGESDLGASYAHVQELLPPSRQSSPRKSAATLTATPMTPSKETKALDEVDAWQRELEALLHRREQARASVESDSARGDLARSGRPLSDFLPPSSSPPSEAEPPSDPSLSRVSASAAVSQLIARRTGQAVGPPPPTQSSVQNVEAGVVPEADTARFLSRRSANRGVTFSDTTSSAPLSSSETTEAAPSMGRPAWAAPFGAGEGADGNEEWSAAELAELREFRAGNPGLFLGQDTHGFNEGFQPTAPYTAGERERQRQLAAVNAFSPRLYTVNDRYFATQHDVYPNGNEKFNGTYPVPYAEADESQRPSTAVQVPDPSALNYIRYENAYEEFPAPTWRDSFIRVSIPVSSTIRPTHQVRSSSSSSSLAARQALGDHLPDNLMGAVDFSQPPPPMRKGSSPTRSRELDLRYAAPPPPELAVALAQSQVTESLLADHNRMRYRLQRLHGTRGPTQPFLSEHQSPFPNM